MYFAMSRFAEAETALRQSIDLTTDVSRNRYQIQKGHFLLGRILMQKGQQDAAHAEMNISRDLANKTLAEDKSKLSGLLDSSGAQDAQVIAEEASGVSPAGTPRADPAALHRVEVLREQIRLPVADSYNNLGAIAATNVIDYRDAVMYFKRVALCGTPRSRGWTLSTVLRAAFAGSHHWWRFPPLLLYLKAH